MREGERGREEEELEGVPGVSSRASTQRFISVSYVCILVAGENFIYKIS